VAFWVEKSRGVGKGAKVRAQVRFVSMACVSSSSPSSSSSSLFFSFFSFFVFFFFLLFVFLLAFGSVIQILSHSPLF
jgi:hypothetical protein